MARHADLSGQNLTVYRSRRPIDESRAALLCGLCGDDPCPPICRCVSTHLRSVPMGTPVPKRDRAHEQANTFSNLVSQRYPWLNLLILNFSYHNAHHELMKCPWYNLPALDRTLFRGDEPHYIPLPKLVRNYHRFRVSRIFSGQGSARDAAGNPSLDAFYGAVEVSLLVLPA